MPHEKIVVLTVALAEVSTLGVRQPFMSVSELPTQGQPTDADLLALVAKGDQEAFRLFYDRFAGRILSYVRKLSRDIGSEEDVVQEVFVQVWRKAATYKRSRGSVAGWLYTMTRNRLVDRWRRKNARIDADENELDRIEAPERGPGGQVIDLSVRQVLSQLSAEQRQAVELAYFGGWTYEETAERLGLPLGTLKSRIRAGLIRMRSLLDSSDSD